MFRVCVTLRNKSSEGRETMSANLPNMEAMDSWIMSIDEKYGVRWVLWEDLETGKRTREDWRTDEVDITWLK